MIKNAYVEYKLEGLNFNKFLTKIRGQNIKILSLKKLDYNIYIIKILKKDTVLFESIVKNYHYKFVILKTSKTINILSKIKSNLALFLCAVILIFGVVITNNIVLKIEVYGLETLTPMQIEQVLATNSIEKGKFKNNYNLNQIELLLKNSLDQVSLVSCVVRGNTLLININEKIDNSAFEGDFQAIVAPYDMVIKDIRLKSGTCVVEKGSTVKKGQEIVLPYIEYKDGTKLSVMAQAEIDAYIEISNTLYYMENHEELVKTGNYVKYAEYSLFNLEWKIGNQTCKYKNFKTEVKEDYVFNNMILPIKKTTYIYYELLPKQVYIAFNSNQEQKLICENESLLYNKLCKNTNVIDYSYLTTTKFVDNIYLVTTYLKANVSYKF